MAWKIIVLAVGGLAIFLSPLLYVYLDDKEIINKKVLIVGWFIFFAFLFCGVLIALLHAPN